MNFTRTTCILLLSVISITGIAQSAKEKAIQEINAAEKAFAQMAADKSIGEAFTFFAADEVTIKRGNDSLIYGKKGVGNFYSREIFKRAKLSWAPDFADASASGDLGYTIGKYSWQLKNEKGEIIQEQQGIFHTVWKKQTDGSWKFVWD